MTSANRLPSAAEIQVKFTRPGSTPTNSRKFFNKLNLRRAR